MKIHPLTTRKSVSLTLDFDLYPRTQIDTANVSSLIDAIIRGEELPPVRIEHGTGRIVDGASRARAHEKLSPGAEIVVEPVEYETEDELFADAIRLNVTHGAKLKPIDIAKTVAMCRERGWSEERIMDVLVMSPSTYNHILETRYGKTTTGQTVILKGVYRKAFAGKTMSRKAEAANEQASPYTAIRLIRELRHQFEVGVVDLGDERIISEWTALLAAANAVRLPGVETC